MEPNFISGEDLAICAEEAYAAAINSFFNDEIPSEEDLSCFLSIDIEEDGSQTLHIKLRPVLRLSAITSNMLVSGDKVTSLYHQDIEVLY